MKQRGFTLLEMVVAMIMVAVLTGAVFSSLHVGFRARKNVEKALAPTLQLSGCMEIIRGELRTALPPTGGIVTSFLGEDEKGDDIGDADSLLFFNTVTYMGWPGHRSGLRQVELTIGVDPQYGRPALIRRITENTLAPVTGDPVDEVLCRNVKSFNLRYFDSSGWVDEWDSEALEDTIPSAIEVTIELFKEDAEDDSEDGPLLVSILTLPTGGQVESEEGGSIVR